MKKMWLVARREYLYNLKRPSFLFAVFGVPIFTFVVWAVVFLVMSNSENNVGQDSKFGYVDHAGVLTNPVALKGRLDEFVAFADEQTARAALDLRDVRANNVAGELRSDINTGFRDAERDIRCRHRRYGPILT